MAALNFPDAPTNGQVFDKWTWDGTVWRLTTSSGPLGWQGFAQIQAQVSNISTLADVTGLSVTWTAVANRRYKTTAFLTSVIGSVAGDSLGTYICDASGVSKIGATWTVPGVNYRGPQTLVSIEASPPAGITVRKVRAERTVGTGVMHIGGLSHILVEDIGSV